MLIKFKTDVVEIETEKDNYICTRPLNDYEYYVYNSDFKFLGQVRYLPNLQSFIIKYEGGL